MAHQNELHTKPGTPGPAVRPMFAGAAIALFVISFFVFGVDNANPEWGNLWMIRPLIVTPLSGAMGGAIYSFIEHQTNRGLNQAVAVLTGIIIYSVVLWLGIVVGLAGTMWD